MDFITLPQTSKKIFIQDNFVSMFKSLLSLPVFIQRNNENFKPFIRENYMGYKKVTIMGASLNLQMDFTLFVFIYMKALEAISNGDSEITWNIKDYYEYADGRDDNGKLKNQSNHNKATIEKKKQSLLKISTFSMMLEDDFNRTHICSFINSVDVSDNNKEYKASISKEFMNFLKVDSKAIYNLRMDFFNSLKKEYAKRLYLSILCHSANDKNTLSIDNISDSFRVEDPDDIDKKFMLNVRIGIKELEDKKFLSHTKEEKNSKNITTGWTYMTNLNARPEREIFKMLPEPKEKKIKPVKETQIINIKPEVKEFKDVDLSSFDSTDMSMFEADYIPYKEEQSSKIVAMLREKQEQDDLDEEIKQLKKMQEAINEIEKLEKEAGELF